MDVSGIFLKATVAKSFSVIESLTCSIEFNECHDKSIRTFLACSVCLLMMGSVYKVHALCEELEHEVEQVLIGYGKHCLR